MGKIFRVIGFVAIVFFLTNCGPGLEALDNIDEKIASNEDDVSKDPNAFDFTGGNSQENSEENSGENGNDSIVIDPPENSQNNNCNVNEKIYLPNNLNQIVIEAEDHQPKGNYFFKNNVNDFMGDGFLVYQSSPRPTGGDHRFDGQSELKYKYRIEEAGIYTFSMRALRYDGGMNYRVENAHDEVACPRATSTDCTQADLNNDCFLGTTGRSPAKIFIGFGRSKDSWSRGGTFDINHVKSDPQVQLEPGVHTLTIQGRSNLFAIDRFYIFKGAQPGERDSSSQIEGCDP